MDGWMGVQSLWVKMCGAPLFGCFFLVGLCLGDRRYDDMYTDNISIYIYILCIYTIPETNAWKTIPFAPFLGNQGPFSGEFWLLLGRV